MAKQHWQKIWSDYKVDTIQERARLEQEHQTIRWREMQADIDKHLGGFKKVKAVEIGAGLGDFSLLMNWEGAKTTLSDYSEEAIAKAKARFAAFDTKAQFVQADMLNVPDKLAGIFNVSFSLGLAEHFENEERYKIIAAHAIVLEKGGLTFISVPYRYSFIYRIWMARHKKRGTWQYGLEIPFSKKEIRALAERAGLTTLGFIQSSFWADANNFFPQLRLGKFMKRKFEKKSVFDKFGYALVYVGKNESQPDHHRAK